MSSGHSGGDEGVSPVLGAGASAHRSRPADHTYEFRHRGGVPQRSRAHEVANGRAVSGDDVVGAVCCGRSSLHKDGIFAAPPGKEFWIGKLRSALPLKVLLYFEDEGWEVGLCSVCGVKGGLGRCAVCGLLIHYSRVAPPLPGQQPPCPRCGPSCDLVALPPLETAGSPPVPFLSGIRRPPTDAEARAAFCRDAE